MTQKSDHHSNGHHNHQPRLRALADAEPVPSRGVDLDAAESAAADLLAALGADLADESLNGTPRRMARLYIEEIT